MWIKVLGLGGDPLCAYKTAQRIKDLLQKSVMVPLGTMEPLLVEIERGYERDLVTLERHGIEARKVFELQ